MSYFFYLYPLTVILLKAKKQIFKYLKEKMILNDHAHNTKNFLFILMKILMIVKKKQKKLYSQDTFRL